MNIRISPVLILLLSSPGFSSELIYQPVNPSFGGSPLNGSYLLSNAQAQNDYKDSSRSSYQPPSELDRFTRSLESRLLSQLLSDVGNGNEGSLMTDDFKVDIQDNDGQLTVIVTDLTTNEVTEISVNGLVPNP